MAEIPERFLVHRVTVEPLSGTGAYGERFLDPVEMPAWVDEKRRMVMGADGRETVSEATIRTSLDYAEHFLPGSYVTIHTELSGVPLRRTRQIAVAYRTDGGMGGWQHLEVTI